MRKLIGAACATMLVACGDRQEGSVAFEPAPRVISPAAVGAPAFAFGSGGDLQIVVPFAERGGTELRAFVSHDSGDTFKDLGPVTPPGTNVEYGGESRPRFIMDRNELLYAAWRQDQPEPGIAVASHDWRTHGYTAPARVRDVRSKAFSGFVDIAAARDGTIYAVWLDERHVAKGSDASAVYFAKSTDGGKTFGKNVVVADHTCGCCRPTIALDDGGRIYVAWRHDFNDVRDMAVASSGDGGKSFSPLARVANDGWAIHGCPESGPSLLPSGERLYIAWFTLGSDSRPRVLESWSDDHGRTFATPVELSTGILDANHPMLFPGKPDGVWVAFQGRDATANAGWSPIRIYVMRLDRPGAHPTAVGVASNDLENPFAVMRDAQSLFIGVSDAGHPAILRGRIYQ